MSAFRPKSSSVHSRCSRRRRMMAPNRFALRSGTVRRGMKMMVDHVNAIADGIHVSRAHTFPRRAHIHVSPGHMESTGTRFHVSPAHAFALGDGIHGLGDGMHVSMAH